VTAKPIFFASPGELRRWFAANHKTAAELHVGFYKVATGKAGLRWSESVDEALCVGWIDGIRHRIDAERYTIRFTPRRPTSIWSRVNIAKVAALVAAGRMKPAGLQAYDARSDKRTGVYSFEQTSHVLPAAAAARLRANKSAAAYFAAQPPWYQRTALQWVTSAKQEATRTRRLATLIADSAAGQPIKQLRRTTGKR
jgi:uncharacterized protein YdeI (YjbR/CyaY-like superfamily)